MKPALPQDRMPEAEVSLRLAFYLLGQPGSDGMAQVAIDGAQVKLGSKVIFPIDEFLTHHGWPQTAQDGKNKWQGTYEKSGKLLIVHARSGEGDVVANVDGKRIRVECKKGPLVKKPGSPEYPILREALGQVLTMENVRPNDVLAVAVPNTNANAKLAGKWRDRPLVKRSKIRIVLVGRDGRVEGF
jgi:hypothetical protein